jgi:hypothetical protein
MAAFKAGILTVSTSAALEQAERDVNKLDKSNSLLRYEGVVEHWPGNNVGGGDSLNVGSKVQSFVRSGEALQLLDNPQSDAQRSVFCPA